MFYNILLIFRFLIYDCDEFTRKYYKEYLKIEQPSAISIEEKFPEPTKKAVKMVNL